MKFSCNSLLLLVLLFFFTYSYDWSPVKEVVDLYYKSGAYPGSVLRVANKTHTLFTY
jgi:hypothetical protein